MIKIIFYLFNPVLVILNLIELLRYEKYDLTKLKIEENEEETFNLKNILLEVCITHNNK